MLNSIKRLSFTINPFIRIILPYLFIVVLIWISRFLLSSSFGLYEDDWPFIGNAVNNTFDQNINMVNKAFFTFWQGRPLHMTFFTFIPSFGSKVGGVNALYFIGFMILSSNACLFYSLLKKISVQPYIPIIATLFFCLYPADTTFNYLLHLFGLQTSLLFLLLAFYFYVIFEERIKYQRIFSYTMAILSLLTYESPFLTFFTAPFLLKNRTKQKIISHFLIVTLILIFYFIIRKITGETRVAELKTVSIIQTLIYQIFVGPIISLGTYFFRPLEIVKQFKIENLLILLIALPILYIVINYFINKEKAIARENSEKYLKLPDLLVLGTAMTILAYPSALTVSANIIDGRSSRVHFAAILGTTIVLSCLWNSLIIKNNSQKVFKKLTIFFLSLHLSFLFVFCINVQQFYALSWKYQQAFWRDVMTLSPDLDQETVILVQAPDLAWGKQINPFDWSVPSVLGSIYNFPKDWKFPPRLYILDSNVNSIDGWKSMIDKNDKFFMSNKNGSLRYYYEWEPERKVDSKNIILLVEENNQLVRKTVLKLSNSNLISLKRNDKKIPLQKYRKSVLFRDLIDDSVTQNLNNQPAIYFESQH